MDLSNIKNPVVRPPDENYQILREDSPAEAIEWLRLSSWTLDDACKLITVGSPETYHVMAEFGLNQEPGTWGHDQFEYMDFVYRKAKLIAASNVSTEDICNPDTPENWIAWARNNGYSADHLLLTSVISNLEALCEDCNNDLKDSYQGQLARAKKVLYWKAGGEEDCSSASPPLSSSPSPVATSDVAFAFDGLKWTEAQWKKPLGNKPKWLDACVVVPGVRGGTARRWNPVLIGAALVRSGDVKVNRVRARFQTVSQLKAWSEVWKDYEAEYFSAV